MCKLYITAIACYFRGKGIMTVVPASGGVAVPPQMSPIMEVDTEEDNEDPIPTPSAGRVFNINNSNNNEE